MVPLCVHSINCQFIQTVHLSLVRLIEAFVSYSFASNLSVALLTPKIKFRLFFLDFSMNPIIPPGPGLPLIHSSNEPLSSICYEPDTCKQWGQKAQSSLLLTLQSLREDKELDE